MPRLSQAARDMAASGLIAKSEPDEIEYPKSLETAEEKAIFRHLMESNPSAHLYSGAVENLLVQMTRHQILADKLAKVIRECNDPKMLISLAKSQKDESQILSTLAVKLKMTPSSVAGKAPPKDTGPRPWEWNG